MKNAGIWLLILTGLSSTAVGAADAYTVVTLDGHRFSVVAKPEIRGLRAYMRLLPRGQLAVIREERIDWVRTEAANVPPKPIVVPADATLVEVDPAPIDLKLVGGRTPAVASGTRIEPSSPEKLRPGYAQEALTKLEGEYARLAGKRDAAVASRATLQEELTELQRQQTSYASMDARTQRRLRELQDRIAELEALINKIEIRLNDISGEVVGLGGAID